MAAVLKARDAGNTLRTLTEFKARDAGNVLRRAVFLKARDDGNVLRTVFSNAAADFTAAAAPTIVTGQTLGTGTATTDAATATPTGGTAPYTYLWTLESYTSGVAPTITSPTAATTTFTQTSIAIGGEEGATFLCTVTDDDGNTAETNIVTAAWVDTT